MAISTGAALLGGAALGGLLGGSKQSGNITQTTSPWAPIQPYVLDVAKKGQQLYNRGPFDYTNVSPFTQQAESLLAQRATSPGSLVGRSQSVIGDTLSGRYLAPDTNPFFKNYVDEALGRAKSAFAGQYGGFAGNNLNNSGYQEALAKNLGTIAGNLYADQYNQERQNQLNATQLAPTLDYANLAALAQVGAAQDARKELSYNAPFNDLARYQQAISGGVSGFGSTTTPTYTNPFANALGGALGVGALSRFGLFGKAAPYSVTGDPIQDAALAVYGI